MNNYIVFITPYDPNRSRTKISINPDWGPNLLKQYNSRTKTFEKFLNSEILISVCICAGFLMFDDKTKMKMALTFVDPIFGLETTTTCPGCGLGTKLR